MIWTQGLCQEFSRVRPCYMCRFRKSAFSLLYVLVYFNFILFLKVKSTKWAFCFVSKSVKKKKREKRSPNPLWAHLSWEILPIKHQYLLFINQNSCDHKVFFPPFCQCWWFLSVLRSILLCSTSILSLRMTLKPLLNTLIGGYHYQQSHKGHWNYLWRGGGQEKKDAWFMAYVVRLKTL